MFNPIEFDRFRYKVVEFDHFRKGRREIVMAKIFVKDTEITVVQVDSTDYICLTDMIKAKDGDFFFSNWLRNRNTIEFLGIWEEMYNLS